MKSKIFLISTILIISNINFLSENMIKKSNYQDNIQEQTKDTYQKWDIKSPYLIGDAKNNLGNSYIYDLSSLNEVMPLNYDYSAAYYGFYVENNPLQADTLKYDARKINWDKLPKFVQDNRFHYQKIWFDAIEKTKSLELTEKILNIPKDGVVLEESTISKFNNHDDKLLGSKTFYKFLLNYDLFDKINEIVSQYNQRTMTKDAADNALFTMLLDTEWYNYPFLVTTVYSYTAFVDNFINMILNNTNFWTNVVVKEFNSSINETVGITLINDKYTKGQEIAPNIYFRTPISLSPIAVWNF